ncbi:MAG: hypothetical protein E6K53_01130 [Gammaproteobacteria bacterium]|nr:MAG: hypothetical protein E6K53_01130 [Gammaproteobacteria bacterium]
MSDMDSDLTPSAAPAATPATGTAAPRRSGTLGWLLALGVVVGAGYFTWRMQSDSDAAVQSDARALHAQVDAVARDVAATKHDNDSLRARLDDASKVNESLRGQLLSLTERARLAEEAIANLAEKRLSGHDALLANEAELLLVLGGERYALFHDPASALDAYRLADAALAQANDAAFSTVRQSINAEIEALGALRAADFAQAANTLGQLRERVATLAPAMADAADAATSPRWAQIFGQFLRIGRDDERTLARNDPALARALLDTSLREAQDALLLRDSARWRDALTRAQSHLAADFDAKNDNAAALRAQLDALAKLQLAPAAPPVLGAALKELRNLRATQAQQPAAPVQAKPAPAQGPTT